MPSYTTKIGHAHLKVRDIDRAVAFYTQFFDLKITERVGSFAFLSGGEFHHELALQGLGNSCTAASSTGRGALSPCI